MQFLDDQSRLVGDQDSSFSNNFQVSKNSSFDFSLELRRLQEISKIERKLIKSGAKPSDVLNLKPKQRNFLDKVNVPRKFRIKSPCLRVRCSLMFCIFVLAMIDFFILLKYMIQISEMGTFKEDYP